jgi:hypothetical protein
LYRYSVVVDGGAAVGGCTSRIQLTHSFVNKNDGVRGRMRRTTKKRMRKRKNNDDVPFTVRSSWF